MIVRDIDVMGLLNTDPLAQIALIGLASVLVVSVGIFLFVLTQRSGKRKVGGEPDQGR